MTTVVGPFYFASTTAAPVSPAFDSDWGVVGTGIRRKLKTVPAGTGSSGSAAVAETSTSIVDVMVAQFVSDSDVLPAGPIAGTFDLVCSCRASGSGAADMFQQIRLHVFDSTGTIKRGTIYDGRPETTVSGTASDPNGEFASAIQETRIMVGVPLTPGTTAQAGDRLVADHGARSCNVSATSRTATIDYRDDGVADHPLTAGLTTNGRPWFKLYLVTSPGAPATLGADMGETTGDLTWTAPATGDPVTGYEVRVDGGGWVDVGLVLNHLVTGLTASTTYDFDVRAYNAAGPGPAASVEGTTDDAPPPDPGDGWMVSIQFGTAGTPIVKRDDVPTDLADSVWVLDGLSIGWSMSEAPTATQPEPVTCQLVLLADDVAELAGLNLDMGADVAVMAYVGHTAELTARVGSFHGRITDLAVEPARMVDADHNGKPAVKVTVDAVDYTADLAEKPVRVNAWNAGAETIKDRFSRIIDEAGQVLDLDSVAVMSEADLHAGDPLDPSTAPARDQLIEALAQAPDVLGRRAILAPHASDIDGVAELVGYGADAVGSPFVFAEAELPGDLSWDAGASLVRLTISQDARTAILPASAIRRAVRWFRNKLVDVNRVDVAGTFLPGTETTVVTRATGATPVVTEQATTILAYREDARELADLLMPDTPSATGWSLDAVRFEGWRDLDRLTPPFVPAHDLAYGEPDRDGCYGRPIIIDGIIEQQNPAGGTWYAATLRGATLTLQRGKYAVDLQLRRGIPRPSTAGAGMTWDDLRARGDLAGRLPANYDPAITYEQLRLVRS